MSNSKRVKVSKSQRVKLALLVQLSNIRNISFSKTKKQQAKYLKMDGASTNQHYLAFMCFINA